MKNFFTVTALIEFPTALALLLIPSITISLLLGISLNESAAMVIARVAGTSLLTISIACWNARNSIQSRTVIGLLIGMLFYNLAVILLFVYYHIDSETKGVLLYPAVLVHAAMAGWCIIRLVKKSQQSINE